MSSKIRFAAVAISAVIAMLGATVALADVQENDADLMSNGNQALALGNVCAGEESAGTGHHRVKKTGNQTVDNNSFQNSATVTFSVQGATTGLSAEMGSPDHVTLPANWRTSANNAESASVNSTITLIAPTTLGAFNGSVSYTATAPRTGGTTSVSGNLAVTATIISCNTAPSVEVTNVDDDATYELGSVPIAGCAVTDAEDGNSEFPATLGAVSGPDAADGIGEQTASCSYTDGGGLVAEDSVTYTIVDPTAPVIGYTLDPADPDGQSGWYTGTVTLTWQLIEDESPSSLVKSGCDDQVITADQASTEYGCSASSAGGSTGPVTVSIRRDGNAPTITDDGPTTGPDGQNGWHVTPVTNGFSASDALSGLADDAQASFGVSTGPAEGNALEVASGAVNDNAGNTNPGINSGAFKIDLSDPTDVAFIAGPAAGASYFPNALPAAPTCTAVDAVSGLNTCSVSGYSTAVGTHTMTATATDEAGRTATASRTYTVLQPWTFRGFFNPIDMNGIKNTVKGGSTVPIKFELFDGATRITDPAGITVRMSAPYTCGSGASDAVEVLASGGSTTLRYDWTSQQFIQNWKTPSTAARQCINVTATAPGVGNSFITATFEMK